MSNFADGTVVEICNYFFDDNISEGQLNDEVRRVAAEVYYKALQMKKLLDLVPRPSGGRPGILWLGTQAVSALWRRQKTNQIYEITRTTLKWQYGRIYTMAKMGI